MAVAWHVVVYDGVKPADLSGYRIMAFFNRSDDMTVPVIGTANDNVVSVVLPQGVYASVGPLIGILRASKDDQVITLATCRWNVRKGPGDEIADTEDIVPNLEELLAKISEMERQINAANVATGKANTAATNANTATGKANTAADKANTAANRLSSVALDVTMLPPSSDPTAKVTQTATQTTFELGIPTSNLAYATFEVEDNTMELLMHSPDGFGDISFQLNNGVLEVSV